MEKASKRGKIPQSDWPLIMARYEAGETLASIARTYDCSPPAISYIVSRNRDKPVSEAPPPPAPEPQLVKNNSNGLPANGVATEIEAKVVSAATPPAGAPVQPDRIERAPATPAIATAAGGIGERQRPRLHLGFGNGNGNGNGHDDRASAPQPQMIHRSPAATRSPATGLSSGRPPR